MIAGQVSWMIGLVVLTRVVLWRATRRLVVRVADPVLSLRQSYAILVGSGVRAQLAYRSSFVVNALTAFAIGALEFTELYVLLATVPTLGGLTLIQVALVFALANTAFSLADLIFGQLDQINRYLREGKLEAFLVRPLPLMAQLVTADFQLRRAGRMVFALLVGAVVLMQADLVLDARTVYLLIITPFVGAAIYGALFALAGGLQFWLVDGAEFTNAFVYGGAYAGQIPGSTLLLPIRVLFTFVIPATIVAYLPAMLILHLPGRRCSPAGWAGWHPCSPSGSGCFRCSSGAPASADSPGPEADRKMAEPIIQMTDLRRSFVVRDKAGRVRRTRRVVHAVDGITATIEAGQSCGYIGANGAGKSTTIKMLSGILVPTSGQVRTCGLDPVPNRRALARDLGVVFGQRSQLWWDLPLRDSFRSWPQFTGSTRPRLAGGPTSWSPNSG